MRILISRIDLVGRSGGWTLADGLCHDFTQLGHEVFIQHTGPAKGCKPWKANMIRSHSVKSAAARVSADVVVLPAVSWTPYFRKDLPEVKAPIVWIPLWEKVRPHWKPATDKIKPAAIVCPIKCCLKLLKQLKYGNLHHCQWSLPLEHQSGRVASWPPTFLSIARSTERRVDWAIQAFMCYREMGGAGRLLVKVPGEYRKRVSDKLVDQIRPLRKSGEINVISRPVPKEKIFEYYGKADASLHFSTEDGVALTMLEAQSTELPIITNDYPPMNEWVTHGVNGLLFPNKRLVERTDKQGHKIYAPRCDLDPELAAKVMHANLSRQEDLQALVHPSRDRAPFLAFWERLLATLK